MSKVPLELVEGRIYWSVAASIESLSYEVLGKGKPQHPWQGKLRISGQSLRLHRFNRDTGQIDDDSNATAFVGSIDRPESIFAMYDEAYEAYVDDMHDWISYQLHEALEGLQALKAEKLRKQNHERTPASESEEP